MRVVRLQRAIELMFVAAINTQNIHAEGFNGDKERKSNSANLNWPDSNTSAKHSNVAAIKKAQGGSSNQEDILKTLRQFGVFQFKLKTHYL